MTEWLARFRKNLHSAGDLWLLARLAGWLAIEPALIRLLPLPKLLAWHTPRRPAATNGRREQIVLYTQFLLSDRLDAFERTCLKRSLVLYRFLQGGPAPVRFFLGVRSDQGRLRGHSWVTVAGQPLYPEEAKGYAVTFSYPPQEEAA